MIMFSESPRVIQSSLGSLGSRPTAMDLPFEIWLHIASFVPTDQLRRLYAVNRILYAIAMTERYKVIDFCNETATIAGTLARLIHSSNTQHVRTLHLYPDVLAAYLARKPTPSQGSKTPSMLSRLYTCTGIPATRHNKRTTKVNAQMRQLVGSMSAVVDLRITTQGHFPHSQFRDQIVMAGWAAFGSTLRNLTLVAPLGEANFPLRPTLVFPNLEHLAIELSCLGLADGTKLVRDLLVAFMNNHHSTLRSLELSLAVSDHANTSVWFLGMRRLPRLSKLSFRYQSSSRGVTDPDTFWHILRMHSAGLRELEFKPPRTRLPDGNNRYPQPPSYITLPQLESLCAALDSFSDLTRTAACLRQCKNSLTVLKLPGRRLAYNEVEMIIKALEGRDKLRVLHLEVDFIGPVLFDLFWARLPNLDQLNLVFFWVTSKFCETIVQQRQSYSQWKLRHLTAHPYLCIEEKTLAEWRAAVGIALSNLQTLEVVYGA